MTADNQDKHARCKNKMTLHSIARTDAKQKKNNWMMFMMVFTKEQEYSPAPVWMQIYYKNDNNLSKIDIKKGDHFLAEGYLMLNSNKEGEIYAMLFCNKIEIKYRYKQKSYT